MNLTMKNEKNEYTNHFFLHANSREIIFPTVDLEENVNN